MYNPYTAGSIKGGITQFRDESKRLDNLEMHLQVGPSTWEVEFVGHA